MAIRFSGDSRIWTADWLTSSGKVLVQDCSFWSVSSRRADINETGVGVEERAHARSGLKGIPDVPMAAANIRRRDPRACDMMEEPLRSLPSRWAIKCCPEFSRMLSDPTMIGWFRSKWLQHEVLNAGTLTSKSLSAFKDKYPVVGDAFAKLGEACHEAGPLDEKTRRLVKLGLAIAFSTKARSNSPSGMRCSPGFLGRKLSMWRSSQSRRSAGPAPTPR